MEKRCQCPKRAFFISTKEEACQFLEDIMGVNALNGPFSFLRSRLFSESQNNFGVSMP